MSVTPDQTRPQAPDWLVLTAIFPEELLARLQRLADEATEVGARVREVCIQAHHALNEYEAAIAGRPDEGLLRGVTLEEALLDATGANALWRAIHEMSGHPVAVTSSQPADVDWLDDRGTPWRRAEAPPS